MLDQLVRRRLRRELLVLRAGYGMTVDNIVEDIMSMPFAKAENRRLDFKSISKHSINDFITGTRATREKTIKIISDYICRKRNIPDFLFYIGDDLVRMARESQLFFRAPGVPLSLAKCYEGYYLSISTAKKIKISIIVDYDHDFKIHFARSKISYIGSDRKIFDIYAQGFAVLKPDTFTIFLRDNLKYDPYILEVPQKNYSISEQGSFAIDYFEKEFNNDRNVRASIKLPNTVNTPRRSGIPSTAYYEFLSILEFWNPQRRSDSKSFTNSFYDIFGSKPMFFPGESSDTIVDKLFDIHDTDRVLFQDYPLLLRYSNEA